MANIRQIQTIPSTFGELALEILSKMIFVCKKYNVKSVHYRYISDY